MQAVKGYIDGGRFTPTDGAVLPNYAHAVLVIQEAFINKMDRLMDEAVTEEVNARSEWIGRLRQARLLAKNDPLPDFITRQPMREPHGLTD